MPAKYIPHFPKPVLDDFVTGRWLPVVGAGMSLNAVLPAGKKMPLWADLGTGLGSELADFSPTSTLDTISAYQHEFGPARLIERLSDLLFIKEAQPGNARRMDCQQLADRIARRFLGPLFSNRPQYNGAMACRYSRGILAFARFLLVAEIAISVNFATMGAFAQPTAPHCDATSLHCDFPEDTTNCHTKLCIFPACVHNPFNGQEYGLKVDGPNNPVCKATKAAHNGVIGAE